MTRFFFTVTVAGSLATSVAAQDNHYWTTQFAGHVFSGGPSSEAPPT